MIRSFIDSGVLIAAARGNTNLSFPTLRILTDGNREFASSAFVQLETLPKAIYHQQQDEADFYQSFFSGVTLWATQLDQIVQEGDRIASTYGLAAIDALHIAAALSVEADELITTEKTTKPMYRVTEIRVISIANS